MVVAEATYTLDEIIEMLKEAGLKPGTDKYREAIRKFAPAGIHDDDGKELYMEI